MRIRLNQNQMDYLYDNFIKSNTNLMLKLRIDKKENVYLIEVNDDIADQIRDWANLQLQRKGFDRHYKLTKESKILDMLIDAFYPKNINLYSKSRYNIKQIRNIKPYERIKPARRKTFGRVNFAFKYKDSF